MQVARYEDRINRAIALIDREIDRHLPLQRLADEACLSAFHFHRLFSALTGESVHALTTRMRMQRALALTAKNAKPQWKSIAAAVGYRSPDGFARAFKRHYGAAPTQFDLESWWQERPDRDAALAVSQYFLRPAPPVPPDFVVTIETRPAAELIMSRAIGSYLNPARLIAAYERMRQSAEDLGIAMPGRLVGASQDDPERVPLSRCRYDFALEVPSGTAVPKSLLAGHRQAGQ